MNEWSQVYGARGLRIIAIHSRGSGAPVADAVAELGITYPVADDRSGDTWAEYGIRATPSMALIGKDGSLLHRQVGRIITDDTVARIEAALAAE